jgi:hypothetical protein
MRIEVHDFEKDVVEEMEIPSYEFDEMGIPARNVGSLYKQGLGGGTGEL